MLIILLKLPRTEKYSIGTEIKTSMYNMLKNILLANKSDKIKRLPIYNIVDTEIYFQRICIRIMHNNKWIDDKKYKHSNELLSEIGKILLPNKEIANNVLNDITIFLKEKLGLTLNSKTRIFKNKQGVNFCRLQNKRI